MAWINKNTNSLDPNKYLVLDEHIIYSSRANKI
jgi:hypothetical protein